MYTETFPDGLDLEIVRFEALEKAWHEANLTSEREHVTLYIKNNRDLFKTQDYVCELGNLKNQRWTIDEPADYDFIKALYEHFAPRWDFSMVEILAFLESNPEVAVINQGFIRNEGLFKSLTNDRILP
jgi:spore coat polysaccharide biosynthesis protein SpsF